MHAASLKSARLQAVLAILKDGRPHSTRDILQQSGQCAINSTVSELRTHGAEISCTRERVGDDWRFFYTMTKGPRTDG